MSITHNNWLIKYSSGQIRSKYASVWRKIFRTREQSLLPGKWLAQSSIIYKDWPVTFLLIQKIHYFNKCFSVHCNVYYCYFVYCIIINGGCNESKIPVLHLLSLIFCNNHYRASFRSTVLSAGPCIFYLNCFIWLLALAHNVAILNF